METPFGWVTEVCLKWSWLPQRPYMVKYFKVLLIWVEHTSL